MSGYWNRLRRSIRRVDIQVSLFMAVIVLVSMLSTFGLCYKVTYDDMLQTLRERVFSIYHLLDGQIDRSAFLDTFEGIDSPADMETASYQSAKELLHFIKKSTGVIYLYTAKETGGGALVYVVDGLGEDEDFRYPGDAIEPEIQPELRRALAGEMVLPDDIKKTEWGKIFITYLPIHREDGSVAGVVGIEFDAEHQYDTYRVLRVAAPMCIVLFCAASIGFAVLFFRRISNPTYQDLANTDQLTQLKNRNAFETDMHNLSHAGRQKGLGMLVADLDHLKQVNDTLGHEAGDRYIRQAAKALRMVFPARTALYRVGGDEFVVLLENTDEAQMQALCAAVQNAFQTVREDWPIKAALSVGFAAHHPASDETLYDTFRRADRAMYETKKRGRDAPDASGYS